MFTISTTNNTKLTHVQQIKRWFVYQHGKDHPSSKPESTAKDPFTPLISKLKCAPVNKPRKPIPYNVWARTHSLEIKEELKSLRRKSGLIDGLVANPPGNSTKEPGKLSEKQAAARGQVLHMRSVATRSLFSKLSKEAQLEWKNQAEQEHAENLEAWLALMNEGPSTASADRQM